MPPGIEAESLYAGYGGEAILRGLTAKIEGDTLILGPNGSGKTTLVKAVLGLASIYSGTLSVDGIDVQEAYGPVEASSLAKASIVAGRAPDSLVTIETERGVFSIVPSGGKPVTDLLSLDRVYEILAGL